MTGSKDPGADACPLSGKAVRPVFVPVGSSHGQERQRKQRRALEGAKRPDPTMVTVTGKYDLWPKGVGYVREHVPPSATGRRQTLEVYLAAVVKRICATQMKWAPVGARHGYWVCA